MRDLYPSQSSMACNIHEEDETLAFRPLPDQPCDVKPGPAKVEILAARRARQEQLFHPLDYPARESAR